MPTTTPFNNLITFSRGSNATVTGPNGLIQWASNNLITFSEQFDNAAWIAFSATASANATLAPDGTRTADKIAEVAGGASQSRYATSTAPYITVTASCYVKASERTFSRIAVSGGGSAQWFGATFDVQNGVVTQQNAGASGTVSGATITAVGDGWYRCTVTGLTGATSGNTFTYIGPSDSGTPTAGSFGVVAYTGTAGSGVFAWGAQLELGSTATTYNPTTVKNLLGFSEAFDNAGWTKTRASIVTGAQANPINGLFNAQKLMEDTTASNTHRVNSGTVTVATGSTVTVSVYVKAAGRTWCRIADGGVTASGAYVNLATGQFGTISAGVTRSSIVSIGDGWYRVSITGVLSGSLSQLFVDLATGDNVNSYTGDGNSGVYIYGAQLSDSASLDPYVPTPGAAPSSTAFYGPRFDFDPVTLLPRGLLVEEQRTNLLLNSLITGANLSTQNVTVTAVAHTISFYGTGSITLSGAHSATVNGTGAYPTRTTLTFTPTAGTLTCTVSGTVQFANLEVGAFATSYIPTVASTVTRSADVATITGQNFAQWYRQDEGCLVAEAAIATADNVGNRFVAQTDAGTDATRMLLVFDPTTQAVADVSSVRQASLDGGTPNIGSANRLAFAYRVNDFGLSLNGGAAATDTSGSIPTTNVFRIGIGASGTVSVLSGHIRNIRFIPARAADFQLQALTT